MRISQVWNLNFRFEIDLVHYHILSRYEFCQKWWHDQLILLSLMPFQVTSMNLICLQPLHMLCGINFVIRQIHSLNFIRFSGISLVREDTSLQPCQCLSMEICDCFNLVDSSVITDDLGSPFLTWLTLILEWISNHIHYKVWNEITYMYPFPNFHGATVEVWEWISNLISQFIMDVITYSCLINVKPCG